MSTPKTTLAKSAAWPGKPASVNPNTVDPAALEICDDPLPAKRQATNPKYAPLFAKMKPGQAIKCQPREVGAIAGSMRKWIKDRKPNAGLIVKTCQMYPGDKAKPGRVWLMAAEKGQK